MISKEEAKEIYIREELNFLKSNIVNKELKEEAMKTLIDNNLFDEAVEEYTKLTQEYSVKIINPLIERIVRVLENYNKEEVLSIIEELKEKDKKFIIREMALEDFFKTEKGSRMDENEKISLVLRVGALSI